MKFDVHTHILPQKLPNLKERYQCSGWINIKPSSDEPGVANMYKNDTFFRRIEKNCWCMAERCKDMEQTKVTAQVLSTVPVMFSYSAKPEHTSDLSRLLNDDMADQIRQNRNKSEVNRGDEEVKEEKLFYGFGTIPMQSPELAVEEMTRCCKDLGFQGIQIGTHINEWNLDEKKLYPIWKVIIYRRIFLCYLAYITRYDRIISINLRELKN